MANLNQHKLKKERQRTKDLSVLYNDDDFKNLAKQRKTLIIEQSKAEFEGKYFDNTDLKLINDNLAKIIKNKFPDYQNPLSIFEPIQNCKLCNDNFYVNGKPCSCVNIEISNILKKESGLSKFANFSQSDFSKYKDSEKMKKLYASLQKWCDNPFASKILNYGFFGYTGNGKTFVMQCMADKLISLGYAVYFTTAFNFLDKIFKASSENDNELLKQFLEVDILFIDDLGTEKFFKNQNEIFLFNVINQRMINNKPIIFSTNLDMESFYERYGERIFSRLINKQNSKTFWFSDSDFRLKLDE